MTNTPFARLTRIAWRESRTARRRLLLYMSSIALGVSALVAIDSFTENVSESVREQSKALLGGDVSLRARSAFGPVATQLLDSLQSTGTEVSRVTTFASMGLIATSGNTRLVQVRAVTPNYPIYGEITTEPAAVWRSLFGGRNALVDPAVLISLDAQVGDTLMLGSARFAIIGTIRNVPGDAGVSAAIGPRVFIPSTYLDETGLLVFGSRAEYDALLRMPPDLSPARFAGRFNQRFSTDTPRVRLETVAENEMDMTQAIDQLGSFLGIVGLVALLLGGIGVASGVHAFVMRKIDTVAILRCLGATSRQVLVIYVMQAAAMGLIGALVGAALGVLFQFGLPLLVRDFLPVDVNVTLAPSAIGLGLGMGVWVALIFALRPLLALRRISPLQTLRRESDATVLQRARRDSAVLVVTFAILASVLAITLMRAGSLERALGYAAAIAAAIGALWATAALLVNGSRGLSRRIRSYVVRQGISNLYRPGNQTQSVVLALGFGVFLMSTMYQVQHNLLRQLDLQLDQSRANVVFFDVQEDQQQGVDSIITAAGNSVVQRAPIIPMRIAAINGQTSANIMQTQDSVARDFRRRGVRPSEEGVYFRQSWALRREFRSTYRAEQTASEKRIAGVWWTPADTASQISVERELAEDLRVGIGDTITWNVQGVQIPAVISSIREVTWARFEPNFFVVFNPGAIERAPKQFAILASAPTSAEVAQLQRAVVRQYPGVSSLDLTLIQSTIAGVLDKVTAAIRFMAIVCLAFGIPVLFSAVAATRRERLREGVLLKTLGATRRQVGRIMLTEYALLGALGSLAGVVLSVAGAWALMKWVFDTSFSPAIGPVLIVGGAMTALAIGIGLATGREVFRQTPMAALREN